MKTLITLATAAFVFPLSILPNAVENCADSTWQYQTVSNTANYELAAEIARDQFCSVVADNVALWSK